MQLQLGTRKGECNNMRSFKNVDQTRKKMHPIQDCKRDPQWIEELGLEFSHKECIINGGWLPDEIINAGQKLLEKSYPAMGGLQSIVLGETLSFVICHGNFVQILNVGRSHWITVSESMIFIFSIMKCLHTCRWSRKNQVTLYDRSSCDISLRTKEQIASICFCDYKEISVKIPDVQRQQGGSDCGLFALAFATSLCANTSPSEIYYTQHQLRKQTDESFSC